MHERERYSEEGAEALLREVVTGRAQRLSRVAVEEHLRTGLNESCEAQDSRAVADPWLKSLIVFGSVTLVVSSILVALF